MKKQAINIEKLSAVIAPGTEIYTVYACGDATYVRRHKAVSGIEASEHTGEPIVRTHWFKELEGAEMYETILGGPMDDQVFLGTFIGSRENRHRLFLSQAAALAYCHRCKAEGIDSTVKVDNLFDGGDLVVEYETVTIGGRSHLMTRLTRKPNLIKLTMAVARGLADCRLKLGESKERLAAEASEKIQSGSAFDQAVGAATEFRLMGGDPVDLLRSDFEEAVLPGFIAAQNASRIRVDGRTLFLG